MDLMEIFTQNVRPSIQKAVRQRWIDETAKLKTRSRHNDGKDSVDYSHHSALRLFDILVAYADSLDVDEFVEEKPSNKHTRPPTRRQHVSIVTGDVPGTSPPSSSTMISYQHAASPVTGYAA